MTNRTAEQEKVAHLLRRFGLGASVSEVEYYGAGGLNGAIDKLLNYENTPSGADVDPQAFANRQGTVNVRVMQGLWYLRLLATARPLEEKMTLFWHNHFATSAEKVSNAFVFQTHVQTLRKGATGSFRELLLSVSKDPGMLYWLDNQENVKGKPNENFAREIMELFTLGVGNYTEKDIQEAARAFTGWAYGRQGVVRSVVTNGEPRRIDRFIFAAERHDEGAKTIFGKTGNWNGDDVVDMLCANPQTSLYLTKKMWEWFAYENPEKAIIEKHAKAFRESGLNIKALIRSIVTSDEFYSESSMRKTVKTPIEFAVSTARQLGAGVTAMDIVKDGVENPVIGEQNGLNIKLVRALAGPFAARQATKSMGMELMYPPDVSGWRTGDYWITTATMIERVKWADALFAGTNAPARPGTNLGGGLGGGRGPSLGIRADFLFDSSPSATQLVAKLLDVFDVSLPTAKVKLLEEAAAKYTATTSLPETCRQVCKLIFGSPEFQMA